MDNWCKLRVSVACDKCGVILYSEVKNAYQTKGGRWEKSFTIKKGDIAGHHNCEVKEVRLCSVQY